MLNAENVGNMLKILANIGKMFINGECFKLCIQIFLEIICKDFAV